MHLKKHLFWIIISALLTLTACGTSKETIVLNCNQANQIINQQTESTQELFNGKIILEYNKELKNSCDNKSFENLKNCEYLPSSKQMACKDVIGFKTEKIEDCKNDENCLAGYLTSHLPYDCKQYNYTAKPYSYIFPENICLTSKAVFFKDEKYCNQIQTKSMSDEKCQGKNIDANYGECLFNRNKCLWSVSDLTNNLKICESESSSPEKDICILSFAIKNKDATLCKKLDTLSVLKTNCEELVKDPQNSPLTKDGVGILESLN